MSLKQLTAVLVFACIGAAIGFGLGHEQLNPLRAAVLGAGFGGATYLGLLLGGVLD
jgi:uncharacterized membrane protein YeiH